MYRAFFIKNALTNELKESQPRQLRQKLLSKKNSKIDVSVRILSGISKHALWWHMVMKNEYTSIAIWWQDVTGSWSKTEKCAHMSK